MEVYIVVVDSIDYEILDVFSHLDDAIDFTRKFAKSSPDAILDIVTRKVQ